MTTAKPTPAQAIAALAEQIERLRRSPCPTMGFDPTQGPEAAAASIAAELAELGEELPGTPEFESEALDVFTCALHMLLACPGLDLGEALGVQAEKLRRRLDVMALGSSWAQAKLLESGVAAWRRGEPHAAIQSIHSVLRSRFGTLLAHGTELAFTYAVEVFDEEIFEDAARLAVFGVPVQVRERRLFVGE